MTTSKFVTYLQLTLLGEVHLGQFQYASREFVTYADVEALVKEVADRPSINLDDGIAAFVEWYKDFYKIDL